MVVWPYLFTKLASSIFFFSTLQFHMVCSQILHTHCLLSTLQVHTNIMSVSIIMQGQEAVGTEQSNSWPHAG